MKKKRKLKEINKHSNDFIGPDGVAFVDGNLKKKKTFIIIDDDISQLYYDNSMLLVFIVRIIFV